MQNYRRLGLVSRLKAPTGGTEKKIRTEEGEDEPSSSTTQRLAATHSTPFEITNVEKAIVTEARVERDADGKIIRVIHAATENPLNDPLNHIEKPNHDHSHQHSLSHTLTDVEEANTDVVRSLLEQSAAGGASRPRHQSEREVEWLGKLVAKHGDDYRAMARDARLNPMQQTASDIAKRIKKMNA